ncbi:hypothetical protein VIGAN_04036100, partial [Vigna angularis var. angularis]
KNTKETNKCSHSKFKTIQQQNTTYSRFRIREKQSIRVASLTSITDLISSLSENFQNIPFAIRNSSNSLLSTFF